MSRPGARNTVIWELSLLEAFQASGRSRPPLGPSAEHFGTGSRTFPSQVTEVVTLVGPISRVEAIHGPESRED